MSRLDLARDRLESALQSLEKTSKSQDRAGAEAEDSRGRVKALEAEREKLLARVAELEEELAALSSLTSEVEGRLDGAIGEIRAALAR